MHRYVSQSQVLPERCTPVSENSSHTLGTRVNEHITKNMKYLWVRAKTNKLYVFTKKIQQNMLLVGQSTTKRITNCNNSIVRPSHAIVKIVFCLSPYVYRVSSVILHTCTPSRTKKKLSPISTLPKHTKFNHLVFAGHGLRRHVLGSAHKLPAVKIRLHQIFTSPEVHQLHVSIGSQHHVLRLRGNMDITTTFLEHTDLRRVMSQVLI